MIVDGTRSIAAGSMAIKPLGDIVSEFFPDAFLRARAAIEAHLPLLWDPTLVTVLLMPSWLVVGVFGMCLIALARPAREKIGYSRR